MYGQTSAVDGGASLVDMLNIVCCLTLSLDCGQKLMATLVVGKWVAECTAETPFLTGVPADH